MEQRKKRILIVEDEKNIADILEYNVQKQGYNTDVAYDGEKGLALALSGGFDLILLDVMLPKMDGFEICRRVRERLDTPIIMLTAREEERDKVFGLARRRRLYDKAVQHSRAVVAHQGQHSPVFGRSGGACG